MKRNENIGRLDKLTAVVNRLRLSIGMGFAEGNSGLRLLIVLFALSVASPHVGQAATRYVSTNGRDSNAGTQAAPWRTIQKAADAAVPGTTVLVAPGTYHEKVVVNVSGSEAEGFITFQADGHAIVSGEGVQGAHMFYLDGRSYVRIIGFDIRDNTSVNTGAGIWIDQSGHHLEIRENRIHEIRGNHAMGIAVYGSSAEAPISDLIIEANEIFDCEPGRSEALTLNGNVTRFRVSNNQVHDVNNIGIDFIGGEGTCPDSAQDAAREGVCVGNRVWNARSTYGEGYAAGIYVDGGRNIVVERNVVTECDLGIEIGAENVGVTASGIIVRNNMIYANDKVGIIFGGFNRRVGRVMDCQFLNNTCFKNDTLRTGNGELAIQFAEGNTVRNNIFHCGPQNRLLASYTDSTNNWSDYNLWYSESGDRRASYVWRGNLFSGLDQFREASGQEAHSVFSDPRFAASDQNDFHLKADSPAMNGGDPGFQAEDGEVDFDGESRISGDRIDFGADEVSSLRVDYIRNGVVTISWPASFEDCVLQRNHSVSASGWTVVPPDSWSVDGARRIFTEPVSDEARFYRLCGD